MCFFCFVFRCCFLIKPPLVKNTDHILHSHMKRWTRKSIIFKKMTFFVSSFQYLHTIKTCFFYRVQKKPQNIQCLFDSILSTGGKKFSLFFIIQSHSNQTSPCVCVCVQNDDNQDLP